jgi:hypothetical protein
MICGCEGRNAMPGIVALPLAPGVVAHQGIDYTGQAEVPGTGCKGSLHLCLLSRSYNV